MESPATLIRRARLGAGLSQRALARRAGTSQSAIARYERGRAVPSWETLQRIVGACGRQVTIASEPVPDPHDIELAELLLELTPLERLRLLRHFARLHSASSCRGG